MICGGIRLPSETATSIREVIDYMSKSYPLITLNFENKPGRLDCQACEDSLGIFI